MLQKHFWDIPDHKRVSFGCPHKSMKHRHVWKAICLLQIQFETVSLIWHRRPIRKVGHVLVLTSYLSYFMHQLVRPRQPFTTCLWYQPQFFLILFLHPDHLLIHFWGNIWLVQTMAGSNYCCFNYLTAILYYKSRKSIGVKQRWGSSHGTPVLYTLNFLSVLPEH
mgnify:CR=1 FL=1